MADRIQRSLRWLLLVLLAIILIEYRPIHQKLQVSWQTPHLDELVPKFGDALLIAWFISLIVDIGAKKELLGEFLFESSAHIIGRQLPEEVREEVRQYLNATFIRPIWKITYELSSIPHLAAVSLKSSYLGELENLTTKRRKFPFKVEIDPSWMAGAPNSKLLRVEIRKGQGNILKSTHNGLLFRETVTVLPGRAGRCESLLECIEHFPESYEYVMINEATVQSTDLTIRWDKELYDVAVSLSSGSDGKVKVTHFETYSVWNINKPLLPGQCILTRWKRKPSKGSTFMAKPLVNSGFPAP